MCNLAELIGGLMTEVSIPSNMRWIPKGMQVEYLKKAKTNLTATTSGEQINWQTPGTAIVPVNIHDLSHDLVFSAKITMQIGTKPSKKPSKMDTQNE